MSEARSSVVEVRLLVGGQWKDAGEHAEVLDPVTRVVHVAVHHRRARPDPDAVRRRDDLDPRPGFFSHQTPQPLLSVLDHKAPILGNIEVR